MSSTALHSDTAARITLLKSRRDAIEGQVMRIVLGGQSIGVPGGMSITQVSLSDLQKELARIKLEIVRLTAGANVTTVLPDFSGDGDSETTIP